jgi:hypothetical protein
MQTISIMVMKTSLYVLLILIPVALPALEPDQKQGWQADPEEIRANEERRPASIWRESAVPEYLLPDPLQRANGEEVENIIQWQEQRHQLLEPCSYWQRPNASTG